MLCILRYSPSSLTASCNMELLTRNCTKALLKELQGPEKIWAYMLMMTEVPRPSHKLDGIRKRILEHVAEAMPQVHAEVDAAGNVLLRKKAAPGMEHLPGICIQGHLDMVTTKVDGLEFDFEKQAIEPQIQGDWLVCAWPFSCFGILLCFLVCIARLASVVLSSEHQLHSMHLHTV